MAYAKGDFDFNSNDPGEGGFFAELFPSGNVMVGWGRRRTKWVKLDQAEVVNFLVNAHKMIVTDSAGRQLSAASLARPPNHPPPDVPPCPGPTGERADWWWYQPFQPQPPPTEN